MKKILAVALALMLLLASAACAETTNRITLSDPVLDMKSEFQEFQTDLAGMSIELNSGSAAGVPTLQADVYGDGQLLMGAELQVVNGNLVFKVEGTTNADCSPAAQYGADATAALGLAFNNMNELFNAPIPAFNGVTLPMMELSEWIKGYETGTRTEGATTLTDFSVPMEDVYALADMLFESAPAAAQSQLQQFTELFDLLKQSGMGLAIAGTATTDGAVSDITGYFYLVQGGQMTQDPILGLYAQSAQDYFYFSALNAYSENSTLGSLTLTSDPGASSLTLKASAMDLFDLTVGLRPEDGLTRFTVDGTAQEQPFNFDGSYGQKNGVDVLELSMLANAATVGLLSNTSVAEDGTRSGQADLYLVQGDDHIEVICDVVMDQGDLTFRQIPNPGRAIDVTQMSEADRNTMLMEISGAASGVLVYFIGALQNAA